jgi:hypothetical protein
MTTKTHKEIIDHVKKTLSPQGTDPVVRLFLKNGTYVKKEFADKAIEELHKKLFFSEFLPTSNLEKIGMMVLYDSSYMAEFLKE